MRKFLLSIIFCASAFQLSHAQIIGNLVSIVPDTGAQGQTLTTTITAPAGTFMTSSGPCDNSFVYLQQGGNTIISNVGSIYIYSWLDNITADFSIPSIAPTGYYDVYMGAGYYDWWTGQCYNQGYYVLYNGFLVTGTTQVKEDGAADGNVNVFPNPFSNNATLSFTNPDIKKYKLTIMDAFGRKIHDEILSSDHAVISRKDFSEGIYFYTLEGLENKFFFSGKFVLME